MRSGSLIGSLIALLSLGACGGIARLDRPGLDRGTAGGFAGAESAGRGADEPVGAEVAGSSAAGTSTGGTSIGGASTGGTSIGGASACSTFEDGAPQPVTIRIRNGTLSPAYLGSSTLSCGPEPAPDLFNVRLFIADGVPDQPEPGGCRVPCQGFLQGNVVAGCSAICFPWSVVKLAPGETLVRQWSGLVDFQRALPPNCNAAHPGAGWETCNVAVREAPGSYEFFALAGSAFQCSSGSTSCGECTPDARGGCTIDAAIVAGSTLAGYSTADLGPSDGIDGPGANSGGASAPRTIDIVLLDEAE